MARKTLNRKAFEIYFRLGDGRSLKKLREALLVEGRRVAQRTLENWSVKFRWQERIAEYAHVEEQADRQAQIKEIGAAQKRQQREGQYLQQKAIQALEVMPDERISPGVAVQMLREGARLEREANGLAFQQGVLASDRSEEGRREVWVHLGGPPDAYMYPDPDPPDPISVPPPVEGENEDDVDD